MLRVPKLNFSFIIAGDEGAWLTYQGTRVIFNGTNGNYAGLVESVTYGGESPVYLDAEHDSPFIPRNDQADVDFWYPLNSPASGNLGQGSSLHIPIGTYEVFIYLNGYDEIGKIIVRSISLGEVLVVE